MSEEIVISKSKWNVDKLFNGDMTINRLKELLDELVGRGFGNGSITIYSQNLDDNFSIKAIELWHCEEESSLLIKIHDRDD